MKTLVVISPDSRFADALGIGLDAAEYRVRPFVDLMTALESVAGGVVDVVVCDGGAAAGDLAGSVTRMRSGFLGAQLVVVADSRDDRWQEDALRAGASQVFGNGLNPSVLAAWLANQPALAVPVSASAGPVSAAVSEAPLEVLSELSEIVSQSLDPAQLAREFMLHVRRLLGVNRASLFLPPADDETTLECAFAAGRRPEAFAGYRLSLMSGIGRLMVAQGRILRSASPETVADESVRRTFADLGAEIAIPVLDQERLLGVAFLDRRVSGLGFTDRELTLLFSVFEVFGVALRNSREHVAIEKSEQLSSGVFDSLKSGCVVVGPGQEILHANPAVREMFALAEVFTIRELPQVIGSKAFAAVGGEAAGERFLYETPVPAVRKYEVTLRPIPHPHGEPGSAILVVIDDVTERERCRQVEAEAAQNGLVRSMAEHLAHEIGNTLVPLSTGQQLMASGTADAETQKGLETVFADSVKRIARLTGQMQFLSREGLRRRDDVPVGTLMDEAFRDAVAKLPKHTASLDVKGVDEALTVVGEKAGLKQVFSEILLNSLQASTADQRLVVHCRQIDRDGAPWVEIEVIDQGPGFAGEQLQRATDPFYSGRSVGLGLGLTVADRIIELHGGSLKLGGPDGGVCVTLPRVLQTAPAAPAN
jgi:signal transduction histidine kinase